MLTKDSSAKARVKPLLKRARAMSRTRDQKGDTQMMHPDHYYFLMSLLGSEAMGFALIFSVRLSQFLFDCTSPAPVTWGPMM